MIVEENVWYTAGNTDLKIIFLDIFEQTDDLVYGLAGLKNKRNEISYGTEYRTIHKKNIKHWEEVK